MTERECLKQLYRTKDRQDNNDGNKIDIEKIYYYKATTLETGIPISQKISSYGTYFKAEHIFVTHTPLS